MKKILLYIILCAAPLMVFLSCTEWDNYDEPKETFYGNIIDKGTNENMFTDHTHDNGTRVKMMEYSWSETPDPFYFAVKGDGTFQNTKIFKGTYDITVFGPFVPILPIKDVVIKGKVKMDFEVEPFLRIILTREPVKNADRTVTFYYKVERGTTTAPYATRNLSSFKLHGGTNPYIGRKDGDVGEYSVDISSGSIVLGTETSVTSKAIPAGRNTVFFRIGGKIADTTIEGQDRYNYSETRRIDF